jgi:hypothetical protein
MPEQSVHEESVQLRHVMKMPVRPDPSGELHDTVDRVYLPSRFFWLGALRPRAPPTSRAPPRQQQQVVGEARGCCCAADARTH